MDTNNRWPTRPSGEPAMDIVDWRTQFPPGMRQKIVNRIISTLRQHYPLHHQEDLDELRKIAIRFEEKILMAASSQNDYITKISSKMLRMVESKSPNPMPNTANNSKAPYPGFQGMQKQVHTQGQTIPSLLQNNQSQASQQFLPQNVPINMASAGVQTCASSQSGTIPVYGSRHNPISNVDGLNSNMQNMSGNSMGQGMPSHVYANQHGQMQGKQHMLPQMQQQLVINSAINNRPRKPASALQQGQLPPPHMHSMQQPQPQINQTESRDNQMNPRLHSMNLLGSVPTMRNNMTSLQHSSLSSSRGVSTARQIIPNLLQSGFDSESGQGNALGSMQQVAPEPLLKKPVSITQQAIIRSLSSQIDSSVLQQNMNPLQSNSNMLQQQNLKQHQDQQMLLSRQHLNQQHQQRRMQQQQQQLDQQAKQQLPTQLQTHQMPQLDQINDVNDMIKRRRVGVNQGAFEQHLPSGQRQSYTHLQLKTGSGFPLCSPQRLQTTTPQIPQHSSPQVDQQSHRISISKTGPLLHSANSPFVVPPSPSTPLAPSPIPWESEKPVPGTCSTSKDANVGHAGHFEGAVVQAVSQSPAIRTPGISASPLLAESIGADANHANALETVSSNSNITEQPIERLMKAVKSMSTSALGAAVSDIALVVSMTDSIAARSAPGNRSRAAIGQDLVAMTKCRLRARNFFTQDGRSVTKKMRREIIAMPLS